MAVSGVEGVDIESVGVECPLVTYQPNELY